MSEELDLVEYRGFKNLFFGLYRGKKYYYMIYGKTGQPAIVVNDEIKTFYGKYQEKLAQLCTGKQTFLSIPFVDNATMISIDNKEEYYRIINILETIMK